MWGSSGVLLGLALAVGSGEATSRSALVREALSAAEAHYARRAEGSTGPKCEPSQVEAALAEYRKALALDPGSLPARLGFMKAVFFRGGYCKMAREPKIALYEEAKKLGEDTVKRLEAGRPQRESRAEVLKREPLAAEVYLWTAVSWGQWSVDHKLAAAWQGAASKIRDLSQAVIDLEPHALEGNGFLILGRLHTEAPRMLFLTGWVSKSKGLELMRQGLKLSPHGKDHLYFVGAALLRHQPESRSEALELLRLCVSEPARPESLVEDRHYVEKARRLLESDASGSPSGSSSASSASAPARP